MIWLLHNPYNSFIELFFILSAGNKTPAKLIFWRAFLETDGFGNSIKRNTRRPPWHGCRHATRAKADLEWMELS